jgi:hypothetical protein
VLRMHPPQRATAAGSPSFPPASATNTSSPRGLNVHLLLARSCLRSLRKRTIALMTCVIRVIRLGRVIRAIRLSKVTRVRRVIRVIKLSSS